MKVLIPMAGQGSRFKSEGYEMPKPLILVNGNEMVLEAVGDLPSGDEYIFLCRKEHLQDYGLNNTLLEAFPNSQAIPVERLTEGQAATCLLAKDHINTSDELLISACDNGLHLDHEAFRKIIKEGADAIVFTFRNHVTVKEKPDQYGWVVVGENNKVLDLSIKKSISSTPMNDHAITGTFWFKRGTDFVRGAEKMIADDRRINGEFYVDEMLRDLIGEGLDVRAFEVEHFICWGTPNDLRTYEYWQSFFKGLSVHPYGKK